MSEVGAFGALRARSRAIRPGVWLAVIVACSTGGYWLLAERIVAPWIMIDELIYSGLAQSFAAHGRFLLRGVPNHGYGVVYPLLIAPAWRLFGPMPSVYVAVKTINCLVMSLTAIPAYFLARRLLPAGLSLLAALLAVLVPDMLYTGMIMTENAFYPLVIAFALLLQVTLERPTALRQVGLVALFGLAYETRTQSVALLAALATAPLVLALVRHQGVRIALRPFLPLYGLLGIGALVALVATLARGKSLQVLLGAYATTTSTPYTLGGVARYLLYHVADFDLLTGVIPFAALLALWFAPRAVGGVYSTFVATSFSLSFWLLIEVAAFASGQSQRIEERYMFYLAPFAFIALLVVISRGAPTLSRAVLGAAALAAGVLPFFAGFSHFIADSATSDTFSLLPWWWTIQHGLSAPEVRYVALSLSLLAAAIFLVLRQRFGLLLPALVGVYLIVMTAAVDNGRSGIHDVSVGTLQAGTELAHPDWIDRAVGRNASVVVLWTGSSRAYPVWEDAFFNRSVGTVYDLDGAAVPDPLPEVPAERLPSGAVESGGRSLTARYVLTDGSFAVRGTVVAGDPIGYDLYRVDGPVVVLTRVSGLYADTWSGGSVTYERSDCQGGTLAVRLESDPQLFHITQTVIAREDGQVVGGTLIPPAGGSTLRVPLHRGAGGGCLVAFTVEHLLVPAQVEPGSTDMRRLGAHFLEFVYRP